MSLLDALRDHPSAVRLRRFFVVGTVAAGVQTGLLWVLVDAVGLWYVPAAVAAIEFTILLQYVINNSWTFRPSGHSTLRSYARGLVKTNLVRGTAIPIQTGLLYAFVEWLGLLYLVANLVAIFLSGLYRYYLDSRWTWSVTGSEPDWRPLAAVGGWLYPYALLAMATFLAGAVAGGSAMSVTSPQALADAADTFRTPPLYPDTLTAWRIFSNNVVALAVVAGGVVSFGLLTLVGLFLNGLLLGTVAYAGLANGDLLPMLALVLPHGVVELPAFFLVGAVAYRVTWKLVSYLRGATTRPITRREALEAAALCVAAVGAIAVAAWIEAELTVDVARLVADIEPGR